MSQTEEALRKKLERQQKQIDQLERYIEDRSRDIFLVNEELRVTNERLTASLEEQKSMQRALVEASRQAGMAEVATSVLHNVGNVLNSVNVSASVVVNIVRASKAQGLSKALGMLRAQPDPGAFLSQDPRGAKLLDYMEGIARTLEGERAKVTAELEALESNIEHIKAIVTMQQTHARPGIAHETISLRELVNDAIRMSASAFGSSHIVVSREFGPVDEIVADAHQLFQIVTNFITNAGQAVLGLEHGRVTVRTLSEGSESVVIEVEDNGVGIDPENLSRIFNHGFTTKPDGHGFGLHSSACNAALMGGKVETKSAGLGLGATFRVVLPRAAPGQTNLPQRRVV